MDEDVRPILGHGGVGVEHHPQPAPLFSLPREQPRRVLQQRVVAVERERALKRAEGDLHVAKVLVVEALPDLPALAHRVARRVREVKAARSEIRRLEPRVHAAVGKPLRPGDVDVAEGRGGAGGTDHRLRWKFV